MYTSSTVHLREATGRHIQRYTHLQTVLREAYTEIYHTLPYPQGGIYGGLHSYHTPSGRLVERHIDRYTPLGASREAYIPLFSPLGASRERYYPLFSPLGASREEVYTTVLTPRG